MAGCMSSLTLSQRIVRLLRYKPRTCRELADKLGLPAPYVRQYLNRLVNADMVEKGPKSPDDKTLVYSSCLPLLAQPEPSNFIG